MQNYVTPWLEEKEPSLAETGPQDLKRAAHNLFGVGVHTGEFGESFWRAREGARAPEIPLASDSPQPADSSSWGEDLLLPLGAGATMTWTLLGPLPLPPALEVVQRSTRTHELCGGRRVICVECTQWVLGRGGWHGQRSTGVGAWIPSWGPGIPPGCQALPLGRDATFIPTACPIPLSWWLWLIPRARVALQCQRSLPHG